MENSFTVSKHFLMLMKVSGLFPMSLVGKTHQGDFKVTFSNIIFTSLSTIVLVCTTVSCFFTDSFSQNESKMVVTSWKLNVKVELFSLLFLFAVQIKKRCAMAKFLEQVEDADSKVIFHCLLLVEIKNAFFRQNFWEFKITTKCRNRKFSKS